MKVLMFGWEFPPFKSGGLGTACYDLTKGLCRQGAKVTFIMPFTPENANAEFVELLSARKFSKNLKINKINSILAQNLKINKINSILAPYQSFGSYEEKLQHNSAKREKDDDYREIYGRNLHEEVLRYSLVGGKIAEKTAHDVIHVHDWMTYRAGMNARAVSGKPLVAHIHATEFDRTGGNPNNIISSLEYEGLMAADIVIANSNFTKSNVIKHYGIDPDKIDVVHWGIDNEKEPDAKIQTSPFPGEKIVLFLGRITIQKGPEYFVEAARKVLDHEPNTRFVVAGSGDMFETIVNRADDLGMIDRFVFTGFLNGTDVHKAYQMADLYVMPSVSEPFGLVALESMKNGTPVLISNQSGASEVIKHALKTDFWDVNDIADKIINTLRYPALLEELKDNCIKEIETFNLDTPAKKVIESYMKAQSMTRDRQNGGIRRW